CASTPPPAPAPARPAWASGPARTEADGKIYFTGIGEDRALPNAKAKAEAFAFQDLADECSFVPKGTSAETGPVDEIGIIERAYARVWIDQATCAKARDAKSAAAIQALAAPEL